MEFSLVFAISLALYFICDSFLLYHIHTHTIYKYITLTHTYTYVFIELVTIMRSCVFVLSQARTTKVQGRVQHITLNKGIFMCFFYSWIDQSIYFFINYELNKLYSL